MAALDFREKMTNERKRDLSLTTLMTQTEYGLGEPTLDRREIPPSRHDTPCLAQHPQDRDHSRL
eukprot:2196681-Pyramimonas_sp.AAC.1